MLPAGNTWAVMCTPRRGGERHLWHRILCGSPIRERRLAARRETLTNIKAKAQRKAAH